jgi:hypothetical protein
MEGSLSDIAPLFERKERIASSVRPVNSAQAAALSGEPPFEYLKFLETFVTQMKKKLKRNKPLNEGCVTIVCELGT